MFIDVNASDLNGISFAEIYYAGMNQSIPIEFLQDSEVGVAQITITEDIFLAMEYKEYSPNVIRLRDGSDYVNKSEYWNYNWSGDNLTDFSSLNFTVANPNDVDIEGPVLNTFSIRDDTLSHPEILHIDYDASDDNGISLFALGFKDENGNDYDAIDLNNDGAAELTINSDMLSGNYEINLILTRMIRVIITRQFIMKMEILAVMFQIQFTTSICLL